MKFDFLSESDQAYFIHKASTLVEALPYIRQHSGDIIVIKYGGHAMGDKKLSSSFAKDIGLLKEIGVSPVIVHGGGPQIAERLKSKKISSNFVDGLRVTDVETIKAEVENSRKMFKQYGWPIIDVTRRSVEETAASIIKIFEIKKNK